MSSRSIASLCRHTSLSARQKAPSSYASVRHFVHSPVDHSDGANNIPVGSPRSSSSTPPTSKQPVKSKSKIDKAANAHPELPSAFPNLMTPHPLYDTAFTTVTRGRRSGRFGRVTIRNDPSYQELAKGDASDGSVGGRLDIDTPANDDMEKNAMRMLSLSPEEQEKLHKYPLVSRRVTQQTGKGKKHRQYLLMVVGNGNGLVGYGEGKHEDFGVTQERALTEAIRNMDFVERFERRTIWTEMSIKLGATRILMRPRPVGFGLHCNPNIHQVLKAAGIKDISAKVWGSRNPINVIKATCKLIQAGNAPLSMGNGIGGKGRRLDTGSGMRSREALERERGRKFVDGRTW